MERALDLQPLTTDDSDLGPVGAAVKRAADRKTRPRRAGGDETRKGPSHQAEKQPETGCQ
jgi:putative transposase